MRQSKAIHGHQAVVKESTVFIARHQVRRTVSKCSINPNLSVAFKEGFLKARKRRESYAISSCTSFWLVGGEVTGWFFRNLKYQFSGFHWSGVYVLVVIM